MGASFGPCLGSERAQRPYEHLCDSGYRTRAVYSGHKLYELSINVPTAPTFSAHGGPDVSERWLLHVFKKRKVKKRGEKKESLWPQKLVAPKQNNTRGRPAIPVAKRTFVVTYIS